LLPLIIQIIIKVFYYCSNDFGGEINEMNLAIINNIIEVPRILKEREDNK